MSTETPRPFKSLRKLQKNRPIFTPQTKQALQANFESLLANPSDAFAFFSVARRTPPKMGISPANQALRASQNQSDEQHIDQNSVKVLTDRTNAENFSEESCLIKRLSTEVLDSESFPKCATTDDFNAYLSTKVKPEPACQDENMVKNQNLLCESSESDSEFECIPYTIHETKLSPLDKLDKKHDFNSTFSESDNIGLMSQGKIETTLQETEKTEFSLIGNRRCLLDGFSLPETIYDRLYPFQRQGLSISVLMTTISLLMRKKNILPLICIPPLFFSL